MNRLIFMGGGGERTLNLGEMDVWYKSMEIGVENWVLQI